MADFDKVLTFLNNDEFKNFAGTLTGLRRSQRAAAAQASTLSLAASQTRQIANYNSSLDELNTNRRLQAEARQTQRILSAQRAAAAGSGFSTSSKTFLMFANEALTQQERTLRQERVSLAHRKDVAQFEAESRARTLEAQASAAKVRGRRQLIEAVPSVLSQIGGLLGE